MTDSSQTQVYHVKLASGETRAISHADVIVELRKLHEWYSGQEKEWYDKTYHTIESFNDGYEREWIRYRQEAAALYIAIELLKGDQNVRHEEHFTTRYLAMTREIKGSPMSGERTLDKLIGYCQMYCIETVKASSVPFLRIGGNGVVVRVGNIAFDCYRHDTGADVRGWIIDGEEAYEFLSVPYWYSSHYTFNSHKWDHGAWDKAVTDAIVLLWSKVDEHKAAAKAAKEAKELATKEADANRKARFERQFA